MTLATADLNLVVQYDLADKNKTPQARALAAVSTIKDAILADMCLPADLHLEVPIEWEHRIPSQLEPEEVQEPEEKHLGWKARRALKKKGK